MAISFEGMDEILNKLDKIDGEKVVNALAKCVLLVERSARQKAPKGDTGNLRNSISSKVENGQGIVFSPLFYAPYVEYGTGIFSEHEMGGRQDVPWVYQDTNGNWHITSGQEPKPFMRPALDENREQILRILKEGLLDD